MKHGEFVNEISHGNGNGRNHINSGLGDVITAGTLFADILSGVPISIRFSFIMYIQYNNNKILIPAINILKI